MFRKNGFYFSFLLPFFFFAFSSAWASPPMASSSLLKEATVYPMKEATVYPSLKEYESKMAYPVAQWIDWFYQGEDGCRRRYNYCAYTCMGRAPKANISEMGDLGAACAAFLTPADPNSFHKTMCKTKEFLCKYGQCDNDRHCYNDNSNHADPNCKTTHPNYVEKVAGFLSCNRSINNIDPDGTPYANYDTADANADLQCKPAGGWWEGELNPFYGSYKEVTNFFNSLNYLVLFQKEFDNSPLTDNGSDYFPQAACLMGCWVAGYMPKNCDIIKIKTDLIMN